MSKHLIIRNAIVILSSIFLYFPVNNLLNSGVSKIYSTQNQKKDYSLTGFGSTAAVGPMVTLTDSIFLCTPRTIRTSETKPSILTINIVPIGHFGGEISTEQPEYIIKYSQSYLIKLVLDNVEIIPNDQKKEKSFEQSRPMLKPISWEWTVACKNIGKRHLIISGIPKTIHSVQVASISWNPEGTIKYEPSTKDEAKFFPVTEDGVLKVPIEILTPSGLTATQNEMVNWISFFCSIIAGFGGLCYLRIEYVNRKEKKNDRKPDSNSNPIKIILPGDKEFNDKI